MSVAMTNCGRVGWVSDRHGYRYDPVDPGTGSAWPPMPDAFVSLAARAATQAGFAGYDPDACLINRYAAGAKLGLHQDRDENDQWAPIVSVSLYPRSSCGAARTGRTPSAACAWRVATSLFGAVPRDSLTTAWLR
jgi:DNA alkylation damage repair protein AlkB